MYRSSAIREVLGLGWESYGSEEYMGDLSYSLREMFEYRCGLANDRGSAAASSIINRYASLLNEYLSTGVDPSYRVATTVPLIEVENADRSVGAFFCYDGYCYLAIKEAR